MDWRVGMGSGLQVESGGMLVSRIRLQAHLMPAHNSTHVPLSYPTFVMLTHVAPVVILWVHGTPLIFVGSFSTVYVRLCERLFNLAKTGSVGITTGEAFCGVVGSKTRKEYTVLVSVT